MRIPSPTMKWFPTVMMKPKTNLKTRGLQLNQNRIVSTEKPRKRKRHSGKIARGKSKQMIESSTNNLIL